MAVPTFTSQQLKTPGIATRTLQEGFNAYSAVFQIDYAGGSSNLVLSDVIEEEDFFEVDHMRAIVNVIREGDDAQVWKYLEHVARSQNYLLGEDYHEKPVICSKSGPDEYRCKTVIPIS